MAKLKFSEIKNRQDFGEFFDAVFRKTYEDLKTRQRFEYEETLPKTYIVEFNADVEKRASEDKQREVLVRTLHDSAEELGIEITETKDPSLAYISSKQGEFFIDSFDPRFLLFHTLAKSIQSDKFTFGRLVGGSHHFDSAWFTVQFFEKLASTSRVEGWDARFNPIPDISEVEKISYSQQRIAVSIDEPEAWNKYEKNKNSRDPFFGELPLDTLRIRRYTDDGGGLARARVHSDGKLTGRGTSFQEYLNIVLEIKNEYRKSIIGLEEKYSILFKKERGGLKLQGAPFNIRFSKAIVKFDDFLKKMFSCTLPFRLLGQPELIKDNYYKVDAIDLHIGNQISFEVTPNFMRIYLPDKTCGNSIVRIIRSLQHEVDSNLVAEIL